MIHIDPRDFAPGAFNKLRPSCAECGQDEHVELVEASVIYPSQPAYWQHDDGCPRWYWLCSPCGAYVGVHRATMKPLGTPAGKATRLARKDAHAIFDPMWQKRMRISGMVKHRARGRGYKWLAAQLGMDSKHCHIGMMDEETARRVVAICRAALSRT